jgi:hypothetical protein
MSGADYACHISGCDLSASFSRAAELGRAVQPLLPAWEGEAVIGTHPTSRQLWAIGCRAVRVAHLLDHGLSPEEIARVTGIHDVAQLVRAVLSPPVALSVLVETPVDAVILAAMEQRLSGGLRAAARAWDEFPVAGGDIAGARLQHVLSHVPQGTANITTFDVASLLHLRGGRAMGTELLPDEVLPQRYRDLCLAGRVGGIDLMKVQMSNGRTLPCVVLAAGWPPRIVALYPAYEDLPISTGIVQTFIRRHGKALAILAFDGYVTYQVPVFRACLAGPGIIPYSVRHSCENPAERAIRLFKDLLPQVEHCHPDQIAAIIIATLRQHLSDLEAA